MQRTNLFKCQLRLVFLGSHVLAMILLFAALAIAQHPGDLDPTFGNGGKLTFGTSFGPFEYPQGFGIATQPDGKIVVASKDTIARLNPDGSFDTTFGNGTGQVAGCCEINYITSIALQPDGKIVTAGGYEADASDFWFLVARHNPDGSLDTSFGNKGHLTTPSSGYARSVNIQKDGRIVVVGTHWYGQIHRYNADGTLDSSFGGGDGIVDRTELGYSYQFYASIVQEDGKIIAVGELWNGPNYYDIAVFRFMPDGSVDTGFGSDGMATAAIGPYSDAAYSVDIQSDGKIVVAGAANNVPGGPFETPNRDFTLARFNSNGSLDTGFGTYGAVKTPINTGDDAARAIRIQSDGRIAVAGYSDDSLLIYDFALVRYHTNGALDTAFGGGDGITTLDFDNAQDRAYGMALDSQGRAVVGGASNKGDSLGVFALSRFILEPGAAVANDAPFDFDGDRRTDISVYRPPDSNWYVLNSGNDPSYSITNWGASTDIETAADFDNDGKADIAVFRPSTGEWFVVNSSDSSFTVTSWGAAGDIPLAADFDGDGRADISVYRPSEGTWYVFRSDGTGWDIVQWGAADDIPVPAKYDSDNKTDIAVYRPSTGEWFVLPSMGTGYAVNWGTSGDKPVAADYDGDAKDDIAIYRPSDGNWYILKSSTNNSQADVISWGVATDIPVPGDYDGDGKADVAQFRPPTGDWFVLRSTSGYDVVNWGIGTDKPVPAAYIP